MSNAIYPTWLWATNKLKAASKRLGVVGTLTLTTIFTTGCTAISSFDGSALASGEAFAAWGCAAANEVMIYAIGFAIFLVVISIILWAINNFGGPLFQMIGFNMNTQGVIQNIFKGTLAIMLIPIIISVVAGVMGASGSCSIGGA